MDPLSFLESKIRSLPLDDYEIYRVEKRHLTAEAREGEIDSLDEAVERGVAVRLFREGRCGFACASEGPIAFLERMLSLAYNSTSILEEEGRIDLPPPASASTAGGDFVEPEGLTKAGKLEMALGLERAAKGFDRRVARVRDASFQEEITTVTLKNSRGLEATHSAPRYELSLMVMAEDRGNQEMAWDSQQAIDFSGLDPHCVAERAAGKAVDQLGGKAISTQRTAAVLDPMVAASFLGVLASSFLGDQVRKNRSALRGKVENEIYSRKIGMVDDGRLPGGFASFPFDGEGTPTRRSHLVVQGVLRGFLHDLASASKEGTVSTGNGVRPSFKEPPRTGATNFFIERGEGALEDLLAEMGTGFWIRDVIGVHTTDPVTGDFSLGASGLWIEGGRRGFPVRGVTISGNLHEVLKKVVSVGDQTRFYHAFGSPPLLIESIDVGGL